MRSCSWTASFSCSPGQQRGRERGLRLQRLGMIRALGGGPVAEHALQDGDRGWRATRREVGGHEIVARGHGDRVVGSQRLLLLGEDALVQLDGVRLAARGEAGPGQAAARGQGAGMIGAEGLPLLGEALLVSADGVRGAPGAQVGGREVVVGHGDAGVSLAQDLAGADHVLPVGNAQAGQPGLVQALAGPQQHRMSLGGPQRGRRRPVQAGRAIAQGLLVEGLGRLLRPRLQQGIGRGPGGLLQHRGRDEPLDHGLDQAVHQHGTRRALRIDRHQAGPGQAVQHHADLALVGRRARGVPPADVGAGRRAGQHRSRDARRVEQRHQHQGVPGHAGR